jgi:hypothetical protein
VAQLGARLNGIQEVRGSNPLGSTKFFEFRLGIDAVTTCDMRTRPDTLFDTLSDTQSLRHLDTIDEFERFNSTPASQPSLKYSLTTVAEIGVAEDGKPGSFRAGLLTPFQIRETTPNDTLRLSATVPYLFPRGLLRTVRPTLTRTSEPDAFSDTACMPPRDAVVRTSLTSPRGVERLGLPRCWL